MNNRPHNNIWLKNSNPELWGRIISAPDDPRLELFPSKQGEPTLKVGTIQLHSRYDPVREAEQVAGRALDRVPGDAVLVICGLGLGYLAQAVRRRFSGPVVVVEPELAIVRAAVQSRNQEHLRDATLAFGLAADEAVDSIEKTCGGGAGWKRVRVIQHSPSVKLNPDYWTELIRRINARRNAGTKGLGILVVTPMYGGSLPVARYCASAFERLGHRVELLDNQIYDPARRQIEAISSNRQHRGQLTGMLTALMAESITARALDRAVDLVFSVAQSPMTPPVLNELRRHHIPVAFWFVEDWQLFSYWREWAPLFDYFFTIQKGEFHQALDRIGVKRVHYLPLAADPEVHRPLKLTPEELAEFGSPVSHVGAGYRNRRQVFSGLTDLDFKLWGNDWEEDSSLGMLLQRSGERLSDEECVKVFNATSINLNLHSSPFHDGVNPEGDYVNPRTFEIAACGAFQLTDRRKLLGELFDTARTGNETGSTEMVTFAHESELRGLIQHYLDHPDERRRIAARARRRVLAEHTYELRMAEALDFIYSYESTPASRMHPDHIDNLLTDAEEDAELTELLGRFRDKGVVTLDDIADDIRQRHGELTRAEAIFILMHEFRQWAREKELV